MSWDQYITNLLATKHVAKAGIYGLDGGKWAASPDMNVTPDEIKRLVAAMKDPTPLYSEGIFVDGDYHIFLSVAASGKALYGKRGQSGCCIAQTTQALVIGLYDGSEGQQAGNCNVAVEKMADYLISKQC